MLSPLLPKYRTHRHLRRLLLGASRCRIPAATYVADVEDDILAELLYLLSFFLEPREYARVAG